MTPLPIAFALPVWLCKGCRNVVVWEDAELEIVDGRLVAVRHRMCVEDE